MTKLYSQPLAFERGNPTSMRKILLICILLLAVFFFFSEKGSGPPVSQNGIAPNQFADMLMAKYDSNEDGKLDVAAESFLRTPLDNVMKVESRGLLFSDADALGNADGSVSFQELENFLNTFDTDHDGELTSFKNVIHSLFSGKSEWGKFDDTYAERIQYEER